MDDSVRSEMQLLPHEALLDDTGKSVALRRTARDKHNKQRWCTHDHIELEQCARQASATLRRERTESAAGHAKCRSGCIVHPLFGQRCSGLFIRLIRSFVRRRSNKNRAVWFVCVIL